ncbi:hypothetical protein P7K49_038223 [Saguinus oedipus]|uniref:Uncharacterized protein n=1 Tax=Saguinus oedipus TaxID=9490 RepID=A0ABQ9TFH4_SAGOE|nr:hypothetical protein P7K49_038223 [Saguinus oedipus]
MTKSLDVMEMALLLADHLRVINMCCQEISLLSYHVFPLISCFVYKAKSKLLRTTINNIKNRDGAKAREWSIVLDLHKPDMLESPQRLSNIKETFVHPIKHKSLPGEKKKMDAINMVKKLQNIADLYLLPTPGSEPSLGGTELLPKPKSNTEGSSAQQIAVMYCIRDFCSSASETAEKPHGSLLKSLLQGLKYQIRKPFLGLDKIPYSLNEAIMMWLALRGEVAPLRENVGHVNDLARQLTTLGIQLSPYNLSTLEDLNTRWKLLQIAISGID